MLEESVDFQRVDAVVLGVERNFRGDALTEYLKTRCASVQIWWGLDAGKNPDLVMDYTYPIRENLLYSRRLLVGELAVSVGHYQIIQRFRNVPIDWLLICEDNLSVENLDRAVVCLNEKVFEKPSLINFSSSRHNLGFPSLSSKGLKRNFTIPTGCKCYAINRSGISKILEGYDKWKVNGFQADFPPFFYDYLTFYYSRDIKLKSDGSTIIGSRDHLEKTINSHRRFYKFGFRLVEMSVLRQKHITLKSYMALKLGRFLAEKLTT